MSAKGLEMWGGIECTVNRIGDKFLDQCARSGHNQRVEDLDLIADLGIKTLRYPVIWETVAPRGLQNANWSLPDERLNRLRELGIEPIVGLVHHGSGAPGTHLLDYKFGKKLAHFAAAVAKRYPWVKRFTPVNEPLTTARFSALYGFWYPHVKDDASFVQAVVNQCVAIRESMSAILKVTPDAELVLTEDMGKTYSTPTLKYQADFENERRWLSLDLITGRTLSAMILEHVRAAGIVDEQLQCFQETLPCPVILGLNHYVTSERYLDERLHLYPEWSHGGNSTHRYADVHATRVALEIDNIQGILRDAWARYGLPLSITEAHLGDSVEEQQRWLWERWQSAKGCQAAGVDVRAVTVWAMFGSYDWNSLLVRTDNFYEPGVFDVRGEKPTPTPLYEMVKALACDGDYYAPHLDVPGWWTRPEGAWWPLEQVSGDGSSLHPSIDS